MSETLNVAADATFDALAAAAFALEPVPPHERKGILRDEAALLLDRLLVRVGRGRGALELAIGESLAALAVGDRTLRLGFSCLGDYSRERLGIAGSTAEKLARLARNLRERPMLREAVWRGEVSVRKAETVLPLARGYDEAPGVARARVETVRSLASAVKEAHGASAEEDEPWERIVLACPQAPRAKLDEAMGLAGRLLGAAAPKWQRLEAICEEFLGANPSEPDPAETDDADAGGSSALLDRLPSGGALEEAKAFLEEETRRWSFLDPFNPVPAPIDDLGLGPLVDLTRLDADLRRLSALRARWDELFGHLALLLRQLGLWRDMKFASFGHYCAERLGMSERAVAQRASLERRLHELPALRAALRDGRVSYEKARVVAEVADESDVDGWIEKARRLSCIALAREGEALEEAQMCARDEVVLRLPERVASLLDSALRAAQSAAGRPLTPGEALEAIADHFIATWKPLLWERNTVQKRVLARDRGHCQVPGCSRAAVQVHHIQYRSHGGADEPANLVSLCAAHHLHAVHVGWVRVSGKAPSRLRWSFRAGAGPARAASLPQ
jgi:hypothetical protein